MAEEVFKNTSLTVRDGGYAYFPGIELSGGKKVSSVTLKEENGHDIVTVSLADGNKYTFSCITDTSSGVSLTDIKEYWNNVPIYDEGDDSQ